jgi:putative transposase
VKLEQAIANIDALPPCGIGFVTPGSRHRGEDAAILAARKKVYAAVKARHPERWSGDIKRLSATKGAWLNPDDEISEINQIEEEVA